jgi:hypothetical protein
MRTPPITQIMHAGEIINSDFCPFWPIVNNDHDEKGIKKKPRI